MFLSGPLRWERPPVQSRAWCPKAAGGRSMGQGSGITRGDRRQNARKERLRALVPAGNAVAGVDLGERKQALVVTGTDGRVLARRSPQVTVHGLGGVLDWAAERARAAGFAGLTVACEPTVLGPRDRLRRTRAPPHHGRIAGGRQAAGRPGTRGPRPFPLGGSEPAASSGTTPLITQGSSPRPRPGPLPARLNAVGTPSPLELRRAQGPRAATRASRHPHAPPPPATGCAPACPEITRPQQTPDHLRKHHRKP